MAAVSTEVLGGRRATVRCAIYTRKSTDEGLDQTFNTLDAQRDAAEAFIRSQRGEGWVALPDHTTTAGTPAPTWTGPHCRGCSRMFATDLWTA
jgi:hypothetical protein